VEVIFDKPFSEPGIELFRIKFIPSNHPLDCLGGDLLGIFFLIKDFFLP